MRKIFLKGFEDLFAWPKNQMPSNRVPLDGVLRTQ